MACIKKRDEWTHGQPETNMPRQLLRSWGIISNETSVCPMSKAAILLLQRAKHYTIIDY